MSISTYTELKSALASLSNRGDLSSRFANLITMAESEIFRELTLHNVETSTSGTTSGSTIAIPTGVSSIQRIKITSAGAEYTLNYTSPNGIEALTVGTDRPTRYTVESGSIRLIPAPNGPYSYTVFYIPLLSALSDTNATNWLLTNHPDVYVKGGLKQIAKLVQNPPDIDRYTAELSAALDSVIRSDERKRLASSGGLQIKPRGVR